MKCRHIYDEVAGKVNIPGCWAAAIYGEGHCSCYNKKEEAESEKSKDKKLISELEKENARLSRIINKLLKNNLCFTKEKTPKKQNHF